MSLALSARRKSNLARSLRRDEATESDDEFNEEETSTQKGKLQRVDLCSNDYLGLARSRVVAEGVARVVEDRAARHLRVLGSTGSRLLTGDYAYARAFEKELAELHRSEDALLFNSGYDANLALLSVLPTPDTLVVADELVHASVHAGLATCRTKRKVTFAHNDVKDLERIIRKEREQCSYPGRTVCTCPILVAIESVYSMDGHVANVSELKSVCRAFGATMVVDEAHGLGTFGAKGLGVFSEEPEKREDPDETVVARVYTFGKALGAHGACVVGSKALRSYLINYAKPLIYSTSLPIHSVIHARLAYQEMTQVAESAQAVLRALSRTFLAEAMRLNIRVVGEMPKDSRVSGASPIWGVVVPGNERCVKVAAWLRAQGFHILPVRSPTVPKGSERLRVILHAYNTEAQVVAFVAGIRTALDQIPETAA